MSVLENIKEKIEVSNSIVILTHEHPDGDAVGSSLALMHGLKRIGKNVDVVIPEVNQMYSILPGFEEIKASCADGHNYDLCIALDSSDLERLHVLKDVFRSAKHTIVIDHHITNQNFGDVNYVNAVASSTCQNIIVILATLDIAINKEMATCIYTGMLTDTGGFRYNVQSETFEFAGMLLETGIDIAKIYKILFDTSTLARTKLLGRAINNLEIFCDGKVAFTYVTAEDFEELKNQDGDQEGIVNYGRDIEGVEVSIFAREKDGKRKVSLRSNEYFNVSLLASKYSGGGHLKAAGFETEKSIKEIKEELIIEIERQMQNT